MPGRVRILTVKQFFSPLQLLSGTNISTFFDVTDLGKYPHVLPTPVRKPSLRPLPPALDAPSPRSSMLSTAATVASLLSKETPILPLVLGPDRFFKFRSCQSFQRGVGVCVGRPDRKWKGAGGACGAQESLV